MKIYLKDRIFPFSLIFSFILHGMGFFLMRIRTAQAASPSEYIQVGLFESKWMEPRMELPGESGEEKDIFESPLHFESLEKEGHFKKRPLASHFLELPKAHIQDQNFVSTSNSVDSSSWKKKTASGEEVAGEQNVPEIEGPVGKRQVLSHPYPVYPDWAQLYGLEFEVRVRFWVNLKGDVERVWVEDSSGYPEVDVEVIRAMKEWRFESLKGEISESQWGELLFKFRLKR
ncbi:MAG: energy transducer TonB [Chlamydiae bacterium]|nr:energy transducer TonB [Chlamydiota bacterium]MBI3266145.1 energy transducer TonB [Chlamydiota bacterium]